MSSFSVNFMCQIDPSAEFYFAFLFISQNEICDLSGRVGESGPRVGSECVLRWLYILKLMLCFVLPLIGNIPWSQAAWSLSHDLDETLCGIV